MSISQHRVAVCVLDSVRPSSAHGVVYVDEQRLYLHVSGSVRNLAPGRHNVYVKPPGASSPTLIAVAVSGGGAAPARLNALVYHTSLDTLMGLTMFVRDTDTDKVVALGLVGLACERGTGAACSVEHRHGVLSRV